jgi:hypothetical protein
MRTSRRTPATLALALLLSACAVPVGSSDSSPSGSASVMPSSSVSEQRAIELAQAHTSSTTLVSVHSGRFADLNTDPHIGPGYPIKPDDLVWAVQFSGDITICNPLGACYSPRPSTATVFLDYATGDFLTTETFSPAN